jgi:AAA-like domain
MFDLRAGGNTAGSLQPVTIPLYVHAMEAPLIFTHNAVWAWFVLGSHSWSFQDPALQEGLLEEAVKRLADLAPAEIHFRVSYRHRDARAWALRYRGRASERGGGLRDVPGTEGLPAATMESYIAAQVKAQQSPDLADKVVMLGIQIAVRVRPREIRRFRRNPVSVPKIADRLDRVKMIVKGTGLAGVPASPADLEWLLHRSVNLGEPEPKLYGKPSWEVEDMGHFTDGLRYHAPLYGDAVKIGTRELGDESRERHVSVLTVGRMDPFDVPDRDPWMTWGDGLSNSEDPQFVEWSARFSLLPPEEMRKAIRWRGNMLRNQRQHFDIKDIDTPPSVDSAYRSAVQVLDELESGNPVYAVSAVGYIRAAVVGSTVQDVRRRAQAVRDAYGPKILVEQPSGQIAAMREFQPCGPLAQTGYKRRMRVPDLAAAMPNVDGALGDRLGFYLGFTASGTRSAVNFEPRVMTELNRGSGLVTIIARQGGGKSVVGGAICYDAVRRGTRTIINDPSGLLAPLADLPEIAPYSQVLDLAKAPAGTLVPWALIAPPNPRNFDTEAEWKEAAREAELARVELAIDIANMMIHRGTLTPEVREAISKAVMTVGGRPDRNYWHVVDALRAMDTAPARIAADALENISDQPLARLYFPPADASPIVTKLPTNEAVLTIIVMSNVRAPAAGTDPESWSISERMAVPALHLSGYLTLREVYNRPRHEPKLMFQDEGSFVSDVASLRSLLRRATTDSRKYNLVFLWANQDAAGLLEDDRVANHVSAAFVGWVTDPAVQEKAMRALGVPLGYGYEKILASFPTRQTPYRLMMHRDAYGRVGIVLIDLSWHPRLLEALRTDTEVADSHPVNWDPDTLIEEVLANVEEPVELIKRERAS